MKASPYFAIQCDETTDVAQLSQLSQLLVYARYVGFTSIEEEMLFCRTLKITTKAEDVFQVELFPHSSMTKGFNRKTSLVSAWMVPLQCLLLEVDLSQG